MEFEALQVDEPILQALREAGYVTPTSIQQQAIPPVLAGRDVLGCAQTGTGKTAAFAVPILQRLALPHEKQGNKKLIRALILTPTRELALQIYDNFVSYGKYTNQTSAVIFGGVSQNPQVDILRRGVDVLIATPGRLWDLVGQKQLNLSNVECFVLDEADRMLDMGFFPDVKRIIHLLPPRRQTLLFSATMPPEISHLADSLLRDPVHIAVTPTTTPVKSIRQYVYMVDRCNKRALLANVIREKGVQQTLVFTRTKHGADRVARDLNRAGIQADSIHGDKSQGARQRALANFKAGKISILVATDIAARGIDIQGLPYVINFDLPEVPETYIHRIGRTGRAGMEGIAISFCDGAQTSYLIDIEELTGSRIEEIEDHAYPMTGEQAAVPAPTKPSITPEHHARKNLPRREKKPAALPIKAQPVPSSIKKPEPAKAPMEQKTRPAVKTHNARRGGGGRRVIDNDSAQVETKALPAQELSESVRARIAEKVAAARQLVLQNTPTAETAKPAARRNYRGRTRQPHRTKND